MNNNNSKIRERLLHEFNLGHSVNVSRQNVCKSMGYDAIKATCAKKWFKNFREGKTSIDDKPRSGRPIAINKDTVLQSVTDNPTLTTRMLAMDNQCSHSQINKILKSGGFRVRKGKWIPHNLSISQKNQRLEMCKQLLLRHDNQTFLNRIVTCDEKWIRLDNSRCSNQWLRKNSEPLRTPKPSVHGTKVMLCVWWWVGGIVHWELVESGRSINAELYSSQLDRVQLKLRQNKLRPLFRRGIILQQDNARPHIAHLTVSKIEELGWERLIHPPYSPDAAPSDYHLFRSLQHSLAENRFVNVDDVKKHLSAYFASKTPDFYRDGIEKLPEIWRKIIEDNGNYFD